MKKSLIAVLIFVFTLVSAAYAGKESVWKRATAMYGSDADRYLYLALPHGNDSESLLMPLEDGENSYFVKEASYRVIVGNGTKKESFNVDFGIKKRRLNIRGIKDGLIIDLGEKEVYDIYYFVKGSDGSAEFHNYFGEVPFKSAVKVFPGFFGSNLFGRYQESEGKKGAGVVGWSIKDGKKEFLHIDPSFYSDMGAKPYEIGERRLSKKRSLLDYAAENWSLISELEVWNLFYYGIDKPKKRKLTGFLKIEFYVKPEEKPLHFGNMLLPFSDVSYEIDYKLSSEYAKALLSVSDYTLVPKRSRFVFSKKRNSGKIDIEIEIEMKKIIFERIDRL